jgi:hypothetical protein
MYKVSDRPFRRRNDNHYITHQLRLIKMHIGVQRNAHHKYFIGVEEIAAPCRRKITYDSYRFIKRTNE